MALRVVLHVVLLGFMAVNWVETEDYRIFILQILENEGQPPTTEKGVLHLKKT